MIPWLLEQTGVDELARPAGEAISFITGLDLSYEDLEGEQPEEFDANPSEDAADDDISMDPDEDLPWPEPTLVETWWAEHQRDFPSGVRALAGAPISRESATRILHVGRQRQRAAAAFELAKLQTGQPLFEVRAPVHRQRAALGS